MKRTSTGYVPPTVLAQRQQAYHDAMVFLALVQQDGDSIPRLANRLQNHKGFKLLPLPTQKMVVLVLEHTCSALTPPNFETDCITMYTYERQRAANRPDATGQGCPAPEAPRRRGRPPILPTATPTFPSGR